MMGVSPGYQGNTPYFVLGRSVGRLLLTFKIEAGFICF